MYNKSMAQSTAHKAATRRFEQKAYDKVLLRLRKDTEPTRDTITRAAEGAGMSLNAFIVEAIREKIDGGQGLPELEHEPFIDNC